MKTIQKIAIITLTLGWFPFMWICAFASTTENKDIVMAVLFTGLFLCLMGSMLSMSIFSNKLFWKKQDEFDKEIEKYWIARKKYEEATNEFVKNQKLQ